MNLLDIVYEFQSLLHKQRSLDLPLDESEKARLVGLDRLLRGDYLGPRSAEMTALLHPIPAQFTRPGGFGAGEIRSISANGMAIVTSHPGTIGTRTVVRVADPLRGVEYIFPGQVVWNDGNVMGVGFDGVPTSAPFLLPTRAGWRRDVRFGGPDETLVA
jgi:hypothetical protein